MISSSARAAELVTTEPPIAVEHEADGSAYTRVDSSISCMLTRFRVRSPLGLIRGYWSYRQVRKQARCIEGLITSRFLIEGPHTYYTFSLWANARAILEFNTRVPLHAWAANSAFRDLQFSPAGPQLWSAQFRLSAVSPHNLRWEGVDLGAAITDAVQRERHHAC